MTHEADRSRSGPSGGLELSGFNWRRKLALNSEILANWAKYG